jgi:DNA-binding PadR family transcriptional regulator
VARTPNRSRQTRELLLVLSAAPRTWHYGYELSRRTGLGSGTLYPLLIRLSDQGLLEAEWQTPDRPGRPPRHAYRLTRSGLAFARELQATNPAPVGRRRTAGATT